MVVEAAWCIWSRRHHIARWQFVEPYPFRNSAPIEPCLTDNRCVAVAGKVQCFQPVKHFRIASPATRRNQLAVFRQRWLPPVADPSGSDHRLDVDSRRRSLLCGPRGAAQLLFDRLPEVLEQVEAIGHLPGLRRALASALRVEAAAIPADDLKSRMLAQPPTSGLGRPVGQHVDDLAPFEVDHDRPVAQALLPGPVIDPDHPNVRCPVARAGVTLQTSQDRVIALWQSEVGHQAFRRTTACGMADKPGEIGHPAGPSGRRPSDLGKPVAEGLTLAALVLASPSRQTHPQRHWRPLSRQVLQMTNLPAVTTGGLGITPGTSSAPLSERTDRPAPITAFRTQELEAGAERPHGIFHHGPPAHSPSQRSSQATITRNEEEPFTVSATTTAAMSRVPRSLASTKAPKGSIKIISDHLTSIARIEIEAAAFDILAETQMEDSRGKSSNGQPIGWCQDTKNAVGQDGPARTAGCDPICGWLPSVTGGHIIGALGIGVAPQPRMTPWLLLGSKFFSMRAFNYVSQ
jgi:hypothetical protein